MENQFFWLLFSFLLTVMVFSYIFGDNPLFRFATYLFVGVSSGYVLILLIYQVIIPKLFTPLFTGDLTQRSLQLIPLVLSVLLMLKLFWKTEKFGDFPLAFLIGSGAAVILVSAFTGTVFPMIDMVTEPFSINSIDFQKFFGGIFLVLGVISSLIYFLGSKRANQNDSNKESGFFRIFNKIGIIFIGLTLGSIFAGVIISSTIALIERLNFIITFIYNLLLG